MAETMTSPKDRRSALKLFRSDVGHLPGGPDPASAPWFSTASTPRPAAIRGGPAIAECESRGPASATVVLISDGDPQADTPADTLDLIRRSFPTHQVRVRRSEDIGDRSADVASGDVIVLDLGRRDCSDWQAFERVRRVNPVAPVVIVTGDRRAELSIEAIKRGAFDILLQPLNRDEFRCVVGRAVEVAQRTCLPAVDEGGADDEAADGLVGASLGMQ